MFEQTISASTKSSLEKLGGSATLKDFYLAGGTALALQIGHRQSLDLDFFNKEEFSEKRLLSLLKEQGRFSLDKKEWQTLHGRFNQTRISFIHYPYPLLYKTNKYLGIKLADIKDIACMKLDAISSRGSKKDFIDLYFIIKQFYSLKQLLKIFQEKYRSIDYNIMHLVKSLVYFDDAESDPMPKMFSEVNWGEIKKFLVQETKKIVDV